MLEAKAARAGISYESLVVETDRRYALTFKLAFIGSVLLSGLWLWVFFRRRRPYLAEHMVVAVHTACVSMGLALLLTVLIPAAWLFSPWIVPALAMSCGATHLNLSIRRVYGDTGGRATTATVLCLFSGMIFVMGLMLYVQMRSLRG